MSQEIVNDKPKDVTTDTILNFFNTPVGILAMNSVQAQATTTAAISLYSLNAVLLFWVAKRIVSDVVDIMLKIKQLPSNTNTITNVNQPASWLSNILKK